MAKPKSAKSRSRTSARETPAVAPPAAKAKRGTQHEANLRSILANRAAKPKLADLRARKESALALRGKLEARNLGVVAKSSAKHARQVGKQISAIEQDYAARAEKAATTRAAKAKGTEATLKALAGGRDELRARAKKLGVVGRSKMSVPELRSAVAKAAAKSGRLGAGMIVAPALAALAAYDATKSKASAAGVSEKQANTSATKAALAAGGVTAAVGIGISAALGMAARSAPKMIGRLVPYVGEGLMAAGAVAGAKKHGAAGAVFWAVGADALLDLPMGKKQMAAEVNPLVDTFNEALGQTKWGKGDFATADAAYHEMRAANARTTSTLRGTQNPTNIAAIVANRQARSSR
jgi:hypothetical protein